MLGEINKKYESEHLAKVKETQALIKKEFLKSIDKIYKKATGIIPKGDTFRISDYPIISNEIDKVFLSFTQRVNFTLQNGVKDEWELSTKKNAEIIHKRYGEKNVSATVNRMIYDPHAAALEEFTKRKIHGLGLSDRVWKYANQFRKEIEENLSVGIRDGLSAVQMARDQAKYLEMPDMLFRRVRNSKGKLVLSKNAKNYKPGRGIYRSSQKNLMRLTRDTINDSYRQADMVRYQALSFVLGYIVSLSNRHPHTDICDDLKGTYPKTFTWLKWHNQCICNCMAKLASPDEYAKYEQAIINGTEADFKFTGQINEVPSNLTTYMQNNKGMMDNWVRKPNWVTDNNIKV